MFGSIPEDLYNCFLLDSLDLAINNFSGSIKPSIGKLSNLQRFKITSNSFEGEIPKEIGNLTKLVTLSLAENKFSGLIPPELSKLSLLQGLSLHGNALGGTIPEKIFDLKQLTRLQLQKNRFTGPIPNSLSKLKSLSHLDLHGNMFNGSIPTSMGHLNQLMILDLSHNNLSGSIPGSLFRSLKSMQIYLNLSYNFLEGAIPDELGMLEMIQEIDFSSNKFSGKIPASLGGCKNLFSLDLSRNKISGPIPEGLGQMDMLAKLNLSRNKLQGELPEKLANLKNLHSLDLSQNQFQGEIPRSFTNFSSLKYLDLSFNQLEGPVPDSGIFQNISASSLVGNFALCGTKLFTACRNKDSHTISKKTMIILITLGSGILLSALVLLILIQNRRIKLHKSKGVENPEPDYDFAPTLQRFDKKDLEMATDFFSKDNIIGSSSLSIVYKGKLENGQIIAVKRLNLHQFSAESDKCFNREINILSQLRHRNLVKVLGYAWESGKLKAIVIGYMENGNLDRIIHDLGSDESRWTLSKRIDIFISVASGLHYLHSGYDFPIIHCDLKPSNVLLDGDWEAHVSDFGTARMLGIHDLQDETRISSSSLLFEGTIGYMAPEVAYMRKVTTKVDVYSYGVIMMEFLTKQRPTSLKQADGSFRELVEGSIGKKEIIEGLVQILDPVLALNICKDQDIILEQLFKLALSCTNPIPEDRPDMNQVLSSLLKLSKEI